MKKILTLSLALLSATAFSQSVEIEKEGIRFCESTYPYNNGILVANFGTEALNPLNTEGKGYILFVKDGKSEVVVPADGNLSAPKGMFLRDGYLYVCDVNKVVVYNIGKKGSKPVTIQFPEGNLFVNDLVADKNYLYASVTNTDKIFRIDISNPAAPGKPQEWATVAGPNGLLMVDGEMYVASYPADGVTKDVNVVYRIKNLSNPSPEKFIEVSGQYDGIALSKDRKSIYLTNWTPAQISRLNLSDKSLFPLELNLQEPLIGPADITVANGKIYIPDLPNSRVVIVDEE